MKNIIFKSKFLIKLLICFLFSSLIYLSFRTDLIYENNLKILISFILILFIIWSIILFEKKKIISIIFYNLFLIVFLNLLLTPIFHLTTLDIPTRQPNYKITTEFKGDFFKGMFFGKHTLSYDEKGYRTNKKILYEEKDVNTLRIFSIGASTTEQGIMDDQKTWSSLLGKNTSLSTKKNVEVINTGMAGLRAEHHYIVLRRIKKYNPDILIFLTGVNDWNHHIVNSHKKYLIPNYEIKYNFKKSIFYKIAQNVEKQIVRKIFDNKKTKKKDETNIEEPDLERDVEAYLLPQIDSLNKRKIVKKFRPNNVSEDYRYWFNLIVRECKKQKSMCIFLDQPTAYKKDISPKLKKRLWMTPTNAKYTLEFEDLIFISSIYNSWLKETIIKNDLNFIMLSDKIEANTKHLFDDCHFTEEGSKKVSEVLTKYINLNLKSILN